MVHAFLIKLHAKHDVDDAAFLMDGSNTVKNVCCVTGSSSNAKKYTGHSIGHFLQEYIVA